MAQYRIPNPWDPHYALPPSVRAEAPGRGTFTSRGLPRGTFFDAGYDPNQTAGYAVPKYVKAEPIGRGVFTTKWLPRRTVGALAPDYLHTLSGDSLGADDMRPTQDPIEMYGTRAAQVVLVELGKTPPKDRPLLMKRILDGVDPALIHQVNRRLKANQERGMARGPALRQALEESFREGLTREFARIGKSKKPQNSGGAIATGLGGLFGDIKGAFSGIVSGHVTVAKKIGGVACTTATHPAAGLAAGAGAAAYGSNPSDAQAGVAIAANVCGGGQYGAAPPSGFPWVPVLAVGAAGLVAVLILTKD
jgi:hypothetical protein